MKYTLLFALPFIFLSLSCQKIESNSQTKRNLRKITPNEPDKKKNPHIDVIYGQDDRKDVFEVKDPNWQEMAQSSIALFDKDHLITKPKHYVVDADHYGESLGLCETEKFYDQPSKAFCSGFLIGPDIMLTAGHCLRNEFNCERVRFVFGYHYNAPTQDPTIIPKENVYQCKEIIHTQNNALTGSDFAIVRLKNEVVNFKPLLLRTAGKLDDNAKLTVIGYPAGLPSKIAFNGIVRDNQDDFYFISTLDTYGGNSGSAVFNSETRLIEGILSRGNRDYTYDTENQCRLSLVCTEDKCVGEGVTRISEIFHYITPADLN